MPADLPQSLRVLADLLEEPQDGLRLGYLAQHVLSNLDACRFGLVEALAEGSHLLGAPRPMWVEERAAHATPARKEHSEEASLTGRLHDAYCDYLATDPQDVRGRALARAHFEKAIQERYPLF